jgi:Rrf2 family nitric oxide-sensitive transcriptional repressor
MRLSEYTDYTLRVLMYCAAHRDRLVTIGELAEQHGLSKNHLMKVVNDLARQGLLETTRGRGGGLRLLAEPETIRIGDVVRATETDFRLVECFDAATNACTLTPSCRLKHLFDDALAGYFKALDGATLADMTLGLQGARRQARSNRRRQAASCLQWWPHRPRGAPHARAAAPEGPKEQSHHGPDPARPQRPCCRLRSPAGNAGRLPRARAAPVRNPAAPGHPPAAHGADRPAQEAASAVMRYFDTAARHHHEDEEQDLFPALLESMAGSDAVCLRELTASLCSDHRLLEKRWASLRQQLLQVAEGAASTLADADIPGFVRLYEQHIAREEAELLPMATRLLSNVELDRIGLAMRSRRGVVAVTAAIALQP